MGTVFADITLKNAGDRIRVECGIMRDPETRESKVRAIVDTGAGTLIINDDIQKELGLMTRHLHQATLANGEKVACKITEAVEVIWKDRSMTCEPWVLPGTKDVLLGAIPLENLDLIVDPTEQKLVGAHGDQPLGMIY
ncbi:MAG: clan AA aspartic protease [Treponema sp.]|jgi:clan AA aspartic protease|nr:clan AA aspartic protease [Treponema sp.]